MSSETSTKATVRATDKKAADQKAADKRATDKHGFTRMDTGAAVAEDPGFQAGHFFVLLSLLAATIAVVMARPSAPEHLILISLTIGACGVAALFLYKMLAPLVAPHSDWERQPMSDRLRQDLEREKALTLRSIKELEFDRAMGKVSPQDFDIMAARLRARALGIMRRLEAGSSAYREVIEKELAQRIGRPVTPPPAPTAVAGMCACGTTNDRDARFCKSCGTKLRAA
jgi:hypothetical protein